MHAVQEATMALAMVCCVHRDLKSGARISASETQLKLKDTQLKVVMRTEDRGVPGPENDKQIKITISELTVQDH